ncbi:MAG: tetratricopeptide repeat protein, partial [bacterium]
IFLNVLRKYPAGAFAPYARFMTGCCRFETGQYRTAIANCEHFMRDSRGREPEARIHHLSARSYAKLGQYETACEKYRKIIAGNPDAACDLALLYYNIGKYDESLHVCRNLLKNKENLYFDIEKTILFLKAMNHYMKGDTVEATAQFQGIINSVPDKEVSGKALFMLGMQYMNTGREDLLTTGYLDLTDREEIFGDNWRAWAYYLIANSYYSAGQIESAEKTFEFIIENYPAAPAAKFAESANVACKAAKGDYAAAELKNREFLANFGDDDTVRKTSLLADAGLLFNRENYREAIAACRDFIKNYPRDETVCEALFMEGECLYNLGHFNDACERWKKIITGNFDSLYILKSYNRLAGTNFGLGKYDTAVFYYRGIRKYFPESDLSKDAQLRIAQSRYNRGKFGAAIDEYKKFLRLYPDEERKKEVLESIRMAYYEKGIKEPGGRGLAEFIKLYPGGDLSGEAYWQLGIRAFEKKQYRQAAKMFRKIIIEYPQIQSSKLSLYYLAESYYMTGKYEDAVNAFENFIGSFPEDTLRQVSEFHMANALFKMGKIEESQKHYSNLLNSSPENDFAGDAALNKALGFKKLKKWKDAVSEYKLFIRKYPEHKKKEYAMFQVAEINRNSGNYKEAADYYAEIRESGEISESELLYQAAECYRASGDIAKAKQYYVNLSNLKKYEKTFYLPGMVQLAEIFLKEGSDSEAVSVYKKIMSNTENEEWLAAAEAKIIEIEEKNKRNEKQP